MNIDKNKKIYTYLVTYDSYHPEFPEDKFSWHTTTL